MKLLNSYKGNKEQLNYLFKIFCYKTFIILEEKTVIISFYNFPIIPSNWELNLKSPRKMWKVNLIFQSFSCHHTQTLISIPPSKVITCTSKPCPSPQALPANRLYAYYPQSCPWFCCLSILVDHKFCRWKDHFTNTHGSCHSGRH